MAGELRGFTFSVTFIVVFAALLSTVPLGLQGIDATPTDLIPVDPSMLTDFTDAQNYTKDDFDLTGSLYIFEYSLGGSTYTAFRADEYRIHLARKILIGGWLFLGQLQECEFIAESGTNRGTSLEWDEVDQDETDGTTRYSLLTVDTGENLGTLITYWNTTEYSDIQDAWDNSELYLLHGIGLSNTGTADIGSLLVSLLLLQLPNVPFLLNMLIAVPIWACIVYVLWFIIKEMIPFV